MHCIKQLICLVVLIPNFSSGQIADSTIIRQVDSLLELSNSHANKREFEKAFEMNDLAERNALQIGNASSFLYGKVIFNRGRLFDFKSDYSNAVKWYKLSLTIFDKIKNEAIFELIKNLNNLGNIYRIIGQFEDAERCLLESLNIQDVQSEVNLNDFSFCLNNLGILYFTLGDYENSESYYKRALLIKEKAVGKFHLDFAVTLICLGNLYATLDNFENAEPIYLQAKEIYEVNKIKNNSDYALLLNNLGILYLYQKNFELSEKYYLQAINLQHDINGAEDSEYAMSINNLGALYFTMGNFIKADSLFLLANSIWLKALGEDHPDYLTSQNNLAAIYIESGNYLGAKNILQKLDNTYERIFGNLHPDFILNLEQLARIYWTTKNYDSVKICLNEVIASKRLLLQNASTFLSETELSNYIHKYLEQMELILTINQESSNLNDVCFDNAIFYKGFLLNARLKLNKLVNLNGEMDEQYKLWKKCNERIAKLYTLKIEDRYQYNLDSLIELSNKLEKIIIRSSKEFNDVNVDLFWEDIQKKLRKDEAAIEFITYSLSDSKAASDSIMYAALIVKSGDKSPQFITLFEEKSLDSLLNSNQVRRADFVASLYGPFDRGAIQLIRQKKSLYQLIWKPIEAHLENIHTIYYSPDGLLHRINLSAIPFDQSSAYYTKTLSDKYYYKELISTRQLAVAINYKPVNREAVLIGGLQFNQDPSYQLRKPVFASRANREVLFSSVDSSLRGGEWDYLPWSDWEVTSLNDLLKAAGIKTKVLKGYEGTEESFKILGTNTNPSPRIVHIATHGYFFPDQKNNSQQSTVSGQAESVFKMSDHPMLRSGLIMAGGNAAWQGKQTVEGREDGILTAYEISQMNLSNTELVVLSACETGLGDIQGNEGVYGLQRAFKIAGAKYLIMSLWQVPDNQTSLLMTAFYKKWLEAEGPDEGGRKMTIPDAFHAAQKELQDLGLDPYQWAGFVLVE